MRRGGGSPSVALPSARTLPLGVRNKTLIRKGGYIGDGGGHGTRRDREPGRPQRDPRPDPLHQDRGGPPRGPRRGGPRNPLRPGDLRGLRPLPGPRRRELGRPQRAPREERAGDPPAATPLRLS